MNEQALICVEKVDFSYNGCCVLKNVSMRIPRGDFVALIGPNGGGKTTLLKLMTGLLKPDRGRVRVFGRQPCEISNRIGFVPQDVHRNRLFPITVMDVVLMGCMKNRHWGAGYNGEDRAGARNALEKLGMWPYKNRKIGNLSGGQRQRVFIARALVNQPEILLLDEPTASIDATFQKELYKILDDLSQAVTIILVSHDLLVLSSHVKSVACVNRSVYYHDQAEVSQEMLEMYQCPVELVAHGIPHRVLKEHAGL